MRHACENCLELTRQINMHNLRIETCTSLDLIFSLMHHSNKEFIYGFFYSRKSYNFTSQSFILSDSLSNQWACHILVYEAF